MSKIVKQKEFHLSAEDEDTKWTVPFFFVQAADTQLGLIDRHFRNRVGWQEELELTRKVVAACNRMEPKPEFLVICGDLVDAYPGQSARKDQVRDLKQELAKLTPDVPLVCVCGNHDIGDEPTMDSLREYKRDFGNDYFYYTLNGVLFIVINSQFYKHRQYLNDYANEHDRWLECMLQKCKLFKHTFVFQHIPWFLEDPDEADDYFNVTKEVRMHWLNKFKQAGVTKIMCGHYHRNAGGSYQGMELVVTSAIGAQFGTDKSGVRLVKVGAQNVQHKYYTVAEIPDKIDLIE